MDEESHQALTGAKSAGKVPGTGDEDSNDVEAKDADSTVIKVDATAANEELDVDTEFGFKGSM